MGVSERKEREFRRREAAIIAAAMGLFRERDLHTVTIEQIAEAAEVGKGTVYKHFQSKDEIYAALVIRLNRAMRADIAAVDTTLPFRARLARIIAVIWEHSMRDAQFLRRLNYQLMNGAFRQSLGPQMAQEFAALQQEESEFYLALLGEAQQRQEVLAGPLDLLLYCASAAIDGAILYFWQMEASGVVTAADAPRHLAQLQDFVHRALTCRSD